MAFITIAGENQIAKKQGDNKTLNIAMFVLANVPNLGSEPATRIEILPNSNVVDQLPVTKSGYLTKNQIVYSLVMGSNIGDYSFNWVGLVDDEGVLIAVSYIPLTAKTKNNGPVPGNTFTRNFLIAYTGIQQTTSINVPAETWQIDFSARLSGIDERERLSNLDIYGHEGFLGDGWKVTGSAGTYSVTAGIGYVGGVRAKNSAPQEITTSTYPNEIWLNVSLQGDISDMTAVCKFVIDTGPFADYVDENGIEHYLTKIATIDAAGEVSDGRLTYENLTQHETKDDPHTQYQTKVLAASQAADQKIYADRLQNKKRLFTVSGDANNIVLASKAGETAITKLNDYDEFSFIVSETNTATTVTIKIDDLEPITVANITDDTQLIVTALATVTYIGGSLYLTDQINPKNGNPVSLIGRLITSPFSFTGAGKMRYDGGELSRDLHPILFALAEKDGLVDQALKDADLKTYGARFGDGDGSTTFTILTFDGAFIRFGGDATGLDVGRVLGSWQDATSLSDRLSNSGSGNIVWSNDDGNYSQSGQFLVTGATGVSNTTMRKMRPVNYSQNAEFYC